MAKKRRISMRKIKEVLRLVWGNGLSADRQQAAWALHEAP